MGALIFMNDKQRMDLTCRMKDADEVLAVFNFFDVGYSKKFTSVHNKGDSTITFVGLRSSRSLDQITDVIYAVHDLCRKNRIGNVYVKTEMRKTAEKVTEAVSTPITSVKRFGPQANLA